MSPEGKSLWQLAFSVDELNAACMTEYSETVDIITDSLFAFACGTWFVSFCVCMNSRAKEYC